MNNNNLDQVSIQSSKRKIARFNFKHSVDTSMGIGEIQVFQCNEVQPDSRIVQSVNSTIRLDPMVAPTAGELNLHHNFLFVGMSELYPKFAAFLAKKPVQFGLEMAVPQYLPNIRLKELCALCMVGAKITIYNLTSGVESSDERGLELYDYSYDAMGQGVFGKPWTTTSTSGTNFLNDMSGVAVADPPMPDMLYRDTPPVVGNVDFSELFNGYNGSVVNIGRLAGFGYEFWVPTRNWCRNSFLEFVGDESAIKKDVNYVSGMTDLTTISAGQDGNNDFVLMSTVTTAGGTSRPFVAAVHMSDFGARLYKLLLGLGYGFDLDSDEYVSLSKLFAVYMAWFNCFSPQLYQGWETTNCAKLLALFDSKNFVDYTDLFNYSPADLTDEYVEILKTFMGFINDVCSMWYTEEQDYISAHIRGSSVASPNSDLINQLGDANINGKVNVHTNEDTTAEPAAGSPEQAQAITDGHAYINNVLHSYLDSEVLKRLYRIVNRETIAGRRIKQLLEAQGLGDYVKRCKSSFIGHDKVAIDIFDVTATSDTLDRGTDKGMYLGEYVGKGVGQDKTKRFKYRNDEIGYIIELAAIVPESGWTNGVDAATRAVKPYDFYHGDLDGLGMEATKKNAVCGVSYFSRPKASASERVGLRATFGYIPQQSSHKVIRNIFNGNFGRHSVQKTYLPYTFNKFIEIGSRNVRMTAQTTTSKSFKMAKLLTPDRLPIASPMYRFIGRYAWMGRFMRIFANLGRDAAVAYPSYFNDYDSALGDSALWFYNTATNDPFIVHNAYLIDYYAHMLPIEDSFGTHEDNNNGFTDMSFGKA